MPDKRSLPDTPLPRSRQHDRRDHLSDPVRTPGAHRRHRQRALHRLWLRQAFREIGADVAITYLNDKARPYVEPLATELGASMLLPLDVTVPGQLEAVFEAVAAQWGRLDILVHSIAFAPKADLAGGLLDCSAEGFAKAMDISCHSFVRMAKLAAPLMTDGGTLFAMSYHGADRVVPNYKRHGPGQGGPRSRLPLSCLRAWPQAHPRARDLAWTAADKGPRRASRISASCSTRRSSGPRSRAGRHHGCRLHLRLFSDALCKTIDGSTVYVDGGMNIIA